MTSLSSAAYAAYFHYHRCRFAPQNIGYARNMSIISDFSLSLSPSPRESHFHAIKVEGSSIMHTSDPAGAACVWLSS